MFEIPFISKGNVNWNSIQCAQNTSARLAHLRDIAEKMLQAGWSVVWTITGLGFNPPYQHPNNNGPEAVRKLLENLGIHESFRQQRSRSVLEIMTERVEYDDRVTYAEGEHGIRLTLDSDGLNWENKEYLCETVQKMVELEDLYTRKELVIENDYQRGILQGRFQVLEWLFGKELPPLEDEEDEWKAEEALEEMDFHNMDRAIDGLAPNQARSPLQAA